MLPDRRLILLPGFGEDHRIFRHVLPYLDGFTIEYVEYKPLLEKFDLDTITVKDFAQAILDEYKIAPNNYVIGHSMGGYLSHRLKQLEPGIANAMIASFTDPRKINTFLKYKKISHWLLNKGAHNWQLFRDAMQLRYKDRGSMGELEITFKVFESYKTEDLRKLAKMMFERPKGLLNWLRSTVKYKHSPGVMIHGIDDWIVSAPEERHYTTPGDHFNLATHPEIVGPLLHSWLKYEVEQRSWIEESVMQEALWGWNS